MVSERNLKDILADLASGPPVYRSTARHEKKIVSELVGYLAKHTDDQTSTMAITISLKTYPKILEICCPLLGKDRVRRNVTTVLKHRSDHGANTGFQQQLVLLEHGAYDPIIWQPNREEVQGHSCPYSLFDVAQACLEDNEVKLMERLESVTDQDGHRLVEYTGEENAKKRANQPLLMYCFGDRLQSLFMRPSPNSYEPALMSFLLKHGALTTANTVTEALKLGYLYVGDLILSMAEHGRTIHLQEKDDKGRTAQENAELFDNTAAQEALKKVFSELGHDKL
jgi:hypothetical protein